MRAGRRNGKLLRWSGESGGASLPTESGRSAGEFWPRWRTNFLSEGEAGFAPAERLPETQLLDLRTARSSQVITMQRDPLSHTALQSALLTCSFHTSRRQLAANP